jgi:hypothetical protein
MRTYKNFVVALPLLLASIVFSASAQTATGDAILAGHLCHTWKISKIVQGGKESGPDTALSDFVLIIHPDHTVEQGMTPDGLIKGTWELDEKKRLLEIHDKETGTNYPMKILSVNGKELVLHDESANSSLTIYYSAR